MYHKNKLAKIIQNVLLIAFGRHIGEKQMWEGPKLSNVSVWENGDAVPILNTETQNKLFDGVVVTLRQSHSVVWTGLKLITLHS